MQLHVPDPAFTSSEHAQANFRLALKLALAFVALLWMIQLLNSGLDLGLGRFGVRPRELAGLPGILVAPLLHGGFSHLASNSLPLIVLGTVMLYLYPNASLKVIPAVYLGPGVACPSSGPPSSSQSIDGPHHSLTIPITTTLPAVQSNEVYPPPSPPRQDSTFVGRQINAIR